MLAESLSSATTIAWLVFTTLVGLVAVGLPLLARALRHGLPKERFSGPEGEDPAIENAGARPIALEPVAFGTSQRARRSPRHAVLQHRTLMAGIFSTLLALFAMPGIAALRELGVSGLQLLMGFVIPTLLVVLHARRRAAIR